MNGKQINFNFHPCQDKALADLLEAYETEEALMRNIECIVSQLMDISHRKEEKYCVLDTCRKSIPDRTEERGESTIVVFLLRK